MTVGTVKRCTRCGIVKPLDEFHKNGNRRRSRCNICDREQRREYMRERYRNNPDVRERVREYREQYLEHSEVREHHRRYNREYMRKYNPDYYQRPGVRERKEECNRERYKNNPSFRLSVKNRDHRRRIIMIHAIAATDEPITLAQWEAIIKHQGNRCPDCGKRFTKKNPPNMDHIVPLSVVPLHSSDNIRAVCKGCNSRKRARLEPGLIQTWIYAGSTGNKIE